MNYTNLYNNIDQQFELEDIFGDIREMTQADHDFLTNYGK
jgi:hypothetical protein